MSMEPWIIKQAEDNLESVKRRFLQSWGWKETCKTPGAYWLWERDFSDYDKRFDAWHEQHPDRPRHYYGVQRVPTELAISMTIKCLYELPEEEE